MQTKYILYSWQYLIQVKAIKVMNHTMIPLSSSLFKNWKLKYKDFKNLKLLSLKLLRKALALLYNNFLLANSLPSQAASNRGGLITFAPHPLEKYPPPNLHSPTPPKVNSLPHPTPSK